MSKAPMSKVSVHLVTWNSMRVLPDALDSLRAQSFSDFDLIVVDNASNDGSVDCVREKFPEATLLRNFRNLGFSHAHGQAIRMARKASPSFVLVMNPDIILMPDCLRKLVDGVEGYREIGSAAPKLLRVRPREEEHGDPVLTDVIDSAGLRLTRARRAVDVGSGEKDGPAFGERREVFGVSGALAFYRLEALDDAALDGEIFDEDFFAYKEDVDLAWRLRLLGWSAAYLPEAVAYHYRGAGGRERASFFEMAEGRRRRSPEVNRLSTRNHLLMLAKNEDWTSALLHGVFLFPYEAVKFLFCLLFAPGTLPAYLDFFRLWPKMLGKRRRIMERRKTPPSEMRKWFR